MFSIFLDGKAPELTGRIFNISRLVTLKKPNADVRPICVTLAKLFGAVVLMKTPPALPTWQLGFATPSGCQKAILKVKNWAGKRQTILTIDIRKWALQSPLAEANLHMNISNELVLFQPISAELAHKFRALGVKLVNGNSSAVRVLGVPISASDRAREEWCDTALAGAVPSRLLAHEKMHPSLALTILKGSDLPRGKFLAETLPPHISKKRA